MYSYQMNSSGQYMLVDQCGAELKYMDRVAVAYTVDQDGACVLHKHGRPEMVDKWAIDMRKRIAAAGVASVLGDVEVIEGRFPLVELNRLISNTTYINTFVAKTKRGEFKPEPVRRHTTSSLEI